MPIIAKQSVEIPAKRYTGKIVNSEIRTSQNSEGADVHYVEVQIDTGVKDVVGWNGRFKASCPAYLTQQSALGRLLKRLNMPFVVGEEFDEQDFVGLSVAFDTKREGHFTNVVLDSMALSA